MFLSGHDGGFVVAHIFDFFFSPHFFVSRWMQMCAPWFTLGYLLKYSTGPDEKQEVKFYQSKDPKVLDAELQPFKNIKLATSKMFDKAGKNASGAVRYVGQTEVDWFLHGFKYTVETVDYEHVNTLEASDRLVMQKNPRKARRVNPDRENSNPWIACRELHPSKRRFTPSQVCARSNSISSSIPSVFGE